MSGFKILLLALMVLIVVLALLGVFGMTRGSSETLDTTLSISAEYPTRFRYKTVSPVYVWVENRSEQLIDTVTVSFDPSYLDKFSNVTFTPSASAVWEVDLTRVQPDERRRVAVEIQAEKYGVHEGEVSATAGLDTVSTIMRTRVFP